MTEQVDVLLATFQGSQYLEELLQSIFTQTHHPLHLLARDDGSSDGTSEILQKWSRTFPGNMTIIPGGSNLGVKGNFSELMKHSHAPYVMFADQDDKWLPSKVEESLELLKGAERQYDSRLPLLVHTDLKVTDQNLKVISPSFWDYAGIDPEKSDLNRLLTQNTVTGCTMLFNRSLADLAYPIPEEAIMHDWWVALVAACFGHTRFSEHPTILYRQHSGNDTGARPYRLKEFFTRQRSGNRPDRTPKTCEQARCLLARYESLFHENENQEEIVRIYGNLEYRPYFEQVYRQLQYRFFKQGFLRNVKNFTCLHR